MGAHSAVVWKRLNAEPARRQPLGGRRPARARRRRSRRRSRRRRAARSGRSAHPPAAAAARSAGTGRGSLASIGASPRCAGSGIGRTVRSRSSVLIAFPPLVVGVVTVSRPPGSGPTLHARPRPRDGASRRRCVTSPGPSAEGRRCAGRGAPGRSDADHRGGDLPRAHGRPPAPRTRSATCSPTSAGCGERSGFRVPDDGLTCVVGIGSDLWDRLFGGPRPAELHPLPEIAGAAHTAVRTPGRPAPAHPGPSPGPVLRAGRAADGPAARTRGGGR